MIAYWVTDCMPSAGILCHEVDLKTIQRNHLRAQVKLVGLSRLSFLKGKGIKLGWKLWEGS